MSRGPCTFKQQDVTRALRATVAAGIEVCRVEIDREGKIVMIFGKSEAALSSTNAADGWDDVR
jgi:hypothetical protein